ncbi:MAG: hypothetical protein ACE5DO_11595 [Desulfobacterales bacterium]
MMKIFSAGLEDKRFPASSILVLRILKKLPDAAKPKSAMLMTMKERWFHWLMEKTLVSSTSKDREERERRKIAAKIISFAGRVLS